MRKTRDGYVQAGLVSIDSSARFGRDNTQFTARKGAHVVGINQKKIEAKEEALKGLCSLFSKYNYTTQESLSLSEEVKRKIKSNPLLREIESNPGLKCFVKDLGSKDEKKVMLVSNNDNTTYWGVFIHSNGDIFFNHNFSLHDIENRIRF